MKTDMHILSYLAQFFIECKILQAKVVEKLHTHILCSITPLPSPENRVIDEIM